MREAVMGGLEDSTPQRDVIVNPASGQTVTFLSEKPEILRTRFDVQRGHASDPRHIHPRQTETITVVEGRIRASFPDRSEPVLEPGQVWEIAPGTPHTWAAIDPNVELLIDFRPALRMRPLLTRLFGLAAEGKTNSRGIPSPLQVVVIAREYQVELRLASPPWIVQRVLFSALAPLARISGYRP
ncbi:MAG: cupin domain-containing protein [Candidatus Dormibacteraceae bacterium]